MTVDGQRRVRAPALPPEERRSELVRATIPLLLAHGEQVTTRQIAVAAGVAEGTIFRVFADKEELVEAAVAAALDPAPLEEALARLDPDRPLAEVVEGAAALLQRRTVDVWCLVARVGDGRDRRPREPMPSSPALCRLLEAHRDELAVEPAEAARRLRAVTLALSHPLLNEEPVPPSEIARFYLHGVGRC